MEYKKIETLFERNEKFSIMIDKLKNPAVSIIKSWQITEKIDGTNIRIILSKEGILTFKGRTDNAQMHSELLLVLMQMFDKEKMKQVFWERQGIVTPVDVILYGEGYGAGIQKGGNYNNKKSFRLFDVLIDNKWWLNWNNTIDIVEKLGIKTVPYLGDWSLEEIVKNVKNGIQSRVAMEDSQTEFQAEGIVGRTIEPLFDKRLNRLIIKLKTKDFKEK